MSAPSVIPARRRELSRQPKRAKGTREPLTCAPAHRHPLDPFFRPRSIAVIGATERTASVGRAIVENLRAWDGETYYVNPTQPHVFGQVSYPDVAALPATPDLVVIVTPAHLVPGIVGECAERGVNAAVIISAGFKECGPDGVKLEDEIRARRGSMRVIGPNCLGVMVPEQKMNATFAAAMARSGSVAFVSQSGALCTAILDWSLRQNVGFSAFVSIGSMLDVGWGDLIDYLGNDPATKSIVCYMESIGDARSFLSAAREVSFTKPIIVIKVGHTDAAAKAAASHTGSMTGSDAVLDAAFRRVGVLRVDTVEEVFDMAEVLAKQPRPRGPHLAMVTNAGGPGALATDMLVSSGAELATLSPETIANLNEMLPAAWSHGNPVDLLGAADPDVYKRSVETVLADANTDGVLVILTPQAMTDATKTAAGLAAIAKRGQKPLLASWMGGSSLDAGREILNAAGIPSYDYPDAAARAFALMWAYSDRLRLLYERPALSSKAADTDEKRRKAERVIASIRKSGRTLLTEAESKEILGAYGIPTVKTCVARTEQQALREAEDLGYPVVLKLYSETITHKTDVGGVQLDLGDAAAVRQAWRAIQKSVSEKVGAKHFGGVTVQPMIKRRGIELIVGSSIDPQFGPVLLFGAGGELVEIVRDRSLGLPPLTATLARRMMERTRIFPALGGARGRKAVDLGELSRVLVAFSHLVAEQRWISEIDINPLLASGDGIIALDARVVLHPAKTGERQLPRLAIRPYPAEYVTSVRLRNKSRVTLRPIRPEDEEMLVAFHSTLSDTTVHFRYFGQIPLEARTAHHRLVRICFSDYDREIALVAEYRAGRGAQRIVGVGRLNRVHGRNEAEFALVVSDDWQHHGLGTRLLENLISIGRAEKFERIVGIILPDNHAMLSVCEDSGFTLRKDQNSGEYAAEFVL